MKADALLGYAGCKSSPSAQCVWYHAPAALIA
nr:MAG TPA: hypothetical protein [Caudoviricetes sp.]DAV29326.1 MAG TPA: hypothetical protein [Caudoviricetes sp.]